MNTYLFIWNPTKWSWDSLEDNISEIFSYGSVKQRWNCKNHRQIRIGDRAFLIKLGKGIDKKGIIGSGYIVSDPFLSEHWDGSGRLVHRVFIEFEEIVGRNNSPILSLEDLKFGDLAEYKWSAIASGVEIPNKISEKLEKKLFLPEVKFAESHNLREGKPFELKITKYERNPFARKVCLDNYGYSCSICEMNFEEKYGAIGRDFIHVHHLKKISDYKEDYIIDPIQDLRPVCPNCHSMIHRKNPHFSIEEIKSVYNKKKV